MNGEKVIAVLRVRDASEMTHEGRMAVAEWMVRAALDLVHNGENYSDTMRARYIVSAKEEKEND